jgi:hypothetical protein
VLLAQYAQADKPERGDCFDEYCAATGCHRKAAIRRLRPEDQTGTAGGAGATRATESDPITSLPFSELVLGASNALDTRTWTTGAMLGTLGTDAEKPAAAASFSDAAKGALVF